MIYESSLPFNYRCIIKHTDFNRGKKKRSGEEGEGGVVRAVQKFNKIKVRQGEREQTADSPVIPTKEPRSLIKVFSPVYPKLIKIFHRSAEGGGRAVPTS